MVTGKWRVGEIGSGFQGLDLHVVSIAVLPQGPKHKIG